MSEKCTYCRIVETGGKNLNVYYDDPKYMIFDDRDKKGHSMRIVIISKEHKGTIPSEKYGANLLKSICKMTFIGIEKYIIFGDNDNFNHWHMTATTINEGSDWNELKGEIVKK